MVSEDTDEVAAADHHGQLARYVSSLCHMLNPHADESLHQEEWKTRSTLCCIAGNSVYHAGTEMCSIARARDVHASSTSLAKVGTSTHCLHRTAGEGAVDRGPRHSSRHCLQIGLLFLLQGSLVRSLSYDRNLATTGILDVFRARCRGGHEQGVRHVRPALWTLRLLQPVGTAAAQFHMDIVYTGPTTHHSIPRDFPPASNCTASIVRGTPIAIAGRIAELATKNTIQLSSCIDSY